VCISKELLNFVCLVDVLALEDKLVEVILLEDIDLDPHRLQFRVGELLSSVLVLFWETYLVQLFDVCDIVYSKTFLKFVWKFLNIFLV